MEGKENKKLSVIVAVYNVESYLDRCIGSIAGQSYANMEIILVDDGSTDGSAAMCDAWAERDSRIKVIHKKNGGAGYARNSGLDEATGDYVAFVDSDDWLEPGMYARLMDEAVTNDMDCVYCGFRQQLPSLESVDVIEMGNVKYTAEDMPKLARRFIMDFGGNQLNFGIWHGIFRRELIDFRFVSEREYMSEDMVFTLMFLRNCRSFSYIPEALYNYMFNAGSLSRNYNEHTFEIILATAGIINEIYRGTPYQDAGNAYAFCQAYFLMRFPIMKARMPLRRKYGIFKKIICNEKYHKMLQKRELFEFQKGLKYKIIRFVYNLHRKKMVRLNFLAVLSISLKKG